MTTSLTDIEVIEKGKRKRHPACIYDAEKHIPLLDIIFSDGEGAHAFCAEAGISYGTFQNWRKIHPDFSEAYDIYVSKAARKWEKYPMHAIENGLKFSYQHWYLMMRSRGYLKNDALHGEKDDGTVDGRLNFIWEAYKKGAISSDDFAKIVNAISGGLRAKELEISSKELDMKVKELEYQRESGKDMAGVSDEAIEAYILVKSGKGKVVKDET
jgi:hypothetical protein